MNVEVAHKERLDDAREVWDAVRASEDALDGSGRVLVRASGTEPLVRVMVEAESEELARRHADSVAEHIAVRPRLTVTGLAPEPDASIAAGCYPRNSCAASWATWAPTRRFPSSSRAFDASNTAATTRPASR